MAKRHLRLPAALCALALLVLASTVQARRISHGMMAHPITLAPPPLERGEERLRVRVVDLQGKPVPGARVMIPRLTDSAGGATTGEDGVATLDNLPDQEFLINVQTPDGGYLSRPTLPGEVVVAIPSRAMMESLGKDRFGPDSAWNVAEWVAGSPLTAEDARAGGYMLCFPFATAEVALEEAVGFLVGLHKKHQPDGLKTLIVLPPGEAPDAERFDGIEGLSVGVDTPVLDEQGSPGYSQAIWGRGQLGLFVGFDGAVRGTVLGQTRDHLQHTEAQVAGWVAEKPIEWSIEAIGPSGDPLAAARAMIETRGQWIELDRDEGGRLRARAVLRDGRGNLVVWQEEENLVALRQITAAEIEDGALRVELEQGVPVVGRIVKEDGQPAEGVAVASIIYHHGVQMNPQHEEGYAVAKTGADGEFVIHSIPSDWRHIQVKGALEGWSPIIVSSQPQPRQTRIELGDLVLRPADREVAGVVVDLDGEPVAGVTIQFRVHMPFPAPAQPLGAESDGEGRFRLEGLSRGQLILQARSPEGQGGSVLVREGQDFAAVVVGDQARLNEMRQSPPPMRVEEWVRGDGGADALADKALALYLVGDPDDPSHKVILQAFDAAAKQADPARFAAVVVYPPAVPEDKIAEDIAKWSDRLIIGVDRPVAEDAPEGLTAALAFAVHHQNRYPVTLYDRAGARLWNSHENQQWAHVSEHFRQQAAQAAEALSAEVTVLDEDGQPVAGALVVPGVRYSHFYGGDRGRTDDQGKLSLPSLMGQPPIAVWTLAPDRGLAGKAEVREEGDKVAIRLAPAPAVSGRIVDTDGNAVPGVTGQLSSLHFFVENRGTFSIPHSLPAPETGEDGRFRVTWLPEQTRFDLSVRAEGLWPQQVRIEPAAEGAAREVGDIVLARADRTVEFRFWTLDGKPFPSLRVQPSGSNASAQSDAQGKATLEGVPDKVIQLSFYGQGGSANMRAAPPGPHHVALATSAEIQQLRSQSGLQPHQLPMWRASQWVVGEAIEREHLEGRNAAVAVIEPAVPREEAKALAAGMARWAGQHGPRGLVTVVLLPPGTDPEEARAMFPEDAPNLHVGIDAPVADADGAPGWTDAVWRGWRGSQTRLQLQDFRGNRRHHSQREGVGEELDEADQQMQAMMQQAPYEWRVAIEGPDGARLTGERLEEVKVIAHSSNHWTEGRRVEGDRWIITALRPSQQAWFIALSGKDNLAGWMTAPAASFDQRPVGAVRLAPADEIQGRLVGPDGEPVAGATVRLVLRLENTTLHNAPGMGAATTGADGAFAFRGVPAGAAREILAQVLNMTPLRMSLADKVERGKLDLGDVALAGLDREIRGLVVNPRGEPIEGVQVRVHNQSAVTGAGGRFELTGLPHGAIHVSAQIRVDNEQRHGSANVQDGQEFAVLVVGSNHERNLASQTIPELRVAEWEGREPPEDLDGRVRLLYVVGSERRGDHEAILHSLSDFAMRFADDRFAAVAIYPPDYSREALRADLEAVYSGLAGIDEPIEGAPGMGWTEALLQARGQGQTPVILADRAGRAVWRFHGGQEWNPNHLQERTVQQFFDAIDVELTVVDPEGQPVAGARVSPAAQYSHFFQSVESGEDGGLSLRALQGPSPMPIAVFHTGRGLAGRVDADGDGFKATVRLEAPPPVTGRVVTRDGEPLAQAHVRPNVSMSRDGRGRWTVHHNEFVNTQTDGQFRFDWIPAGTEVRLHIHCGGYFNENILVEPDERNMGDIALYKADQQATFTVLGLDGEPVAGVHVNAGGRGTQTGSDGKATITGLPDKPVPVSVHGNIARSVSYERGPGEHTLTVVSAEQRQRLEAARRGAGATPLWRVGKWVKGTPVGFDAAPPAMAIVVSDTLDERGIEDLAERAARLGERFGERMTRLAFILPHDTAEPAAERIAQMVEGFSVGLDEEIEAVGGVGYSQMVCSAFVSGSAFTAFVKTPDARQVQLVQGRGDLDQPLRRLEGLLDQFVSRLPPSPEARIAELKRRGEVVSQAQDPFEEHHVWLVLKTGIARATPEEGLREWSSVLGMRQYRPVGLAFTERAVFIGTDQGLISFARATDSWNRIAPAGDYDLMTAPVKGIEQDGDRIAVVFETPDGGETAHVLEGGRWR